jgi:xanthine dehydrogenase accessory factor
MNDLKVVIKGAGEMATGIACRLYAANITNIVMLEIANPVAIRRTVAFSESIYDREVEVEGTKAVLVDSLQELDHLWVEKQIGVTVDPEWKTIQTLKPDVVIDAILAKKNLGTKKGEAGLVVGVGPGFVAPHDVHMVVESNRGHNLGKVIYEGSAEPHTGIPGSTMGFTVERVLRAPHAGMVRHVRQIGDIIMKGDIALYVDRTPVVSIIDGLLRGLIREIYVEDHEKVADVDPRGIKEYCHSITDKARAIGGGVLEAVTHYYIRG